ncbi:hypothetical protein F5884DRAFT_376289 [Xylogone sp. PMI_703]|nr:hypothetical protein F5884DRAFT_376289 [Xylogone sp. PMI_703]
MLGGTKAVVLLPQAILLLGWIPLRASANIITDPPKHNPLGIDWYPAPSPEDGPPLSRGASRDKSLLPAQIGGIVGAYVFSVCVVALGLVLVGRKLRRKIQEASRALDVELVEPGLKPGFKTYVDPSPISPGAYARGTRNFSWPSPEKTDRNPYIFPATSTSPQSSVREDPFVDRRVVEADREMLQRDLEDIYAHVMVQDEAKAKGIILKDPVLPPGRMPAEAPQRHASPSKKAEKAKPSQIDIENTKSKHGSLASSILSSIKSPKGKGIRSMRISSPLRTPASATFPKSAASDEEPLSPRFYAPPPPPPVPRDQVPFTHSRNTSSSAVSRVSPVSPTQTAVERPWGAPEPQRHPRPNMSQTSVQSSQDPSSATSATSQTPLFSGQSQAAPPVPRSLPFRAYDPPTATSPSGYSVATKTTILERTSPLSPGLHSGMRTPWSAGAVPYSPYQPFTPVVPITPTLVTKADRKRVKKAMPRTPVTELIKSDDELWDSGY